MSVSSDVMVAILMVRDNSTGYAVGPCAWHVCDPLQDAQRPVFRTATPEHKSYSTTAAIVADVDVTRTSAHVRTSTKYDVLLNTLSDSKICHQRESP